MSCPSQRSHEGEGDGLAHRRAVIGAGVLSWPIALWPGYAAWLLRVRLAYCSMTVVLTLLDETVLAGSILWVAA